MSSTPAAKRSLKPNPITANPQQQQTVQFPTTTDLPSLQPAHAHAHAQLQDPFATFPQPTTPVVNSRKRKSVILAQAQAQEQMATGNSNSTSALATAATDGASVAPAAIGTDVAEPKAKKSRTNTPWTAGEEQRLKQMRDAGNSWSEIAKTFPQRTEGSVKKHWYKDMHYAEFAEDESAALLAAIKEYDQNKWKFIGQKVNKPAKACEQYAKENFGGKY